MKNCIKEIAIIFIGLFVLGIIISHYFNPVENPFGISCDAKEYWHLSSNLLKNKGFVYTDPGLYPSMHLNNIVKEGYPIDKIIVSSRVPGYPFLLAFIRKISDTYFAAILFNYLCYLGICIYGILLGFIFFPDKRFRLIYDILLVFSPVYLMRWGVGADISGAFFLLGFTYHILKLNMQKSMGLYDFFGTLLYGLLATFTRANLIVFVFVFLIFTIIRNILIKHKKAAISSIAIMLIFLTLVGLWMLRVKRLTHNLGLSAQSGFVLYKTQIYFHIDKNDPLSYWYEKGPKELFIENYKAGKNFNEIEGIIDKRLKKVVFDYYKEYPYMFLRNWAEGVRTFFMLSLAEISNVTAHIASEYIKIEGIKEPIKRIVFQMERFYKIIVAVSCVMFLPLFLLKKWKEQRPDILMLLMLFTATWAGILSTAFFTGAGDRMRLPFNAFILVFSVMTSQILFLPWKWEKAKNIKPKNDKR